MLTFGYHTMKKLMVVDLIAIEINLQKVTTFNLYTKIEHRLVLYNIQTFSKLKKFW